MRLLRECGQAAIPINHLVWAIIDMSRSFGSKEKEANFDALIHLWKEKGSMLRFSREREELGSRRVATVRSGRSYYNRVSLIIWSYATIFYLLITCEGKTTSLLSMLLSHTWSIVLPRRELTICGTCTINNPLVANKRDGAPRRLYHTLR